MLKRAIRFCTLGALIGSCLASSRVMAAIPRALYKPIYFTKRSDFSKGMDLNAMHPLESLRDLNYQSIQQIIPNDMDPTSDGGIVATQILDHSLSSFFNSPEVRRSDLGRTATRVEKTMEGDLAIGGTEPDSVKHCFKLAMRATQTKALLEYSGLTNAQLSYNIGQDKLNFEVHEEMIGATQVVFNHITIPGENKDILSLRWKW